MVKDRGERKGWKGEEEGKRRRGKGREERGKGRRKGIKAKEKRRERGRGVPAMLYHFGAMRNKMEQESLTWL